MLTADIEGFVLTGGASARMGTPKALIEFDGKPLGRRAVEVLEPICRRVRTVGDVKIDGVQSMADVRAENEKASIFGLYSALRNCKTQFAAVLACDLPFVTPEVFSILLERFEIGCDAVIPRDGNGWPQPFCAVYAKEPSLKKLEQFISLSGREVREFLSSANLIYVDSDDLGTPASHEEVFFNINTPDDLERARAMTR